MRAIVGLVVCLAACSHEHLDFAPHRGADGGLDQAGGQSFDGSLGEGFPGCSGRAGCPDASFIEAAVSAASVASSASARAGTAGSGAAPSSRSAANAPSPSNPQSSSDTGPAGYPTPPGQWASWCDSVQSGAMLSVQELCGTHIDEDCDGLVDEFKGIGLPCANACGGGSYGCDPATNALVCIGCKADVPPPCGDGFVGAGEECDPAASGEERGVTCTADCHRPLFVRCLVGGLPKPDLCNDLSVCDPHIGACVPVIGPHQPRCPNLPVEGGVPNAQFYPMLETENGECWITCSDASQCPSTLSECYMGFCVVAL